MLLGKNSEIAPEKNEEAEPKQIWHPILDVLDGEVKSVAVKNNIV